MGLLVLGALSAAVSTGTFASFNATTTNSAQVTTATLVLGNSTDNYATECFSAGSGTQTISSANSNGCNALFGASLLEPGTPTATAHVALENDGNVNASHLYMFLPSCTNSGTYKYTDPHGNQYSGSAANLCGQLDVNIWSTGNTYNTGTGTCLYGGAGTCASFDNAHTLSSFATAHGNAGSAIDLASAGLAPGVANSKYLVIEVQLDSSADNTYQALQSSGAFNFELVQ